MLHHNCGQGGPSAAQTELDTSHPRRLGWGDRESCLAAAAVQGKDYGKARMTYPDFTTLPSGLQYIDLVTGLPSRCRH